MTSGGCSYASNYDGSLDSYMDDFINKVAYGLNLVFSNGIGYPRTSFLPQWRGEERATVQILPCGATNVPTHGLGTRPIPGSPPATSRATR